MVQLGGDHPVGESPKAAEEPTEPVLPPNPKVTRVTPPEKQDPAVKYKEASKQRASQSEWGSGDDGYKPPRSPSDKMRKNVPYKVEPFLI